MKQQQHSPGLHPDSILDLRYLNYLVNSRYQEVSASHHHMLKQRQAHRRVINHAGLTIDSDRAQQYDYFSCSRTQKPILTGPETAPNQTFDVGSSRKRSFPCQEQTDDDGQAPPDHEPEVDRRRRLRTNQTNRHRHQKLKIRIPPGKLFLMLVQLQRSSTVPAVIQRHQGRWILARAHDVELESGHSSCDHSYDSVQSGGSSSSGGHELVTIRVPVLSSLTSESSCET